MTQPSKISRVGFAVIKLRIQGESFYLMRRSRKWGDISFIGGHENERDSGKLARAAYRELLEEVPSFRATTSIELAELTTEFCYGPVNSRSAGTLVGYELQFFLVKFLSTPENAIRALGPRSQNILLTQTKLLMQEQFQISGLVDLLNAVVPGGLPAIADSWQADFALRKADEPQTAQLHLQWN